MADKDKDQDKDAVPDSILGDIRPRTPDSGAAPSGETRRRDDDHVVGGPPPDEGGHVGSRDVTEGTTGGTGTVTGGTRNYRQGTGATGTDIGNRPE